MISIDGESLTIDQIIGVARNNEIVKIDEGAKIKIIESRNSVLSLVDGGETVYGINTGFGSLAKSTIAKDISEKLQTNLIKSHSCGVGRRLSEEDVRAAMIIRINNLAKGFSGIRLETINTLVEMLNKKVHPIIPEKGSVGASGDLAPLSHMVLVMIGGGEAIYNGKIMPGAVALKKARIKPIKLSYKEGLALTNGTGIMTAIGTLAIFDSEKLLETSEVAAALSLESLRGRSEAFDSRIHTLRNQEGQIISAEKIRRLVKNSKLINSNKQKVQDSYSLRCIPQVHGAVRDTINYVKQILNKEINAVTDNPLIIDGTALSGGNFHGEPIAFAMDFLGIALAELGDISERRIAKLVDKDHNDELPAFLIERNGLNSGFMIPQYTAASLVSENKILAHPASVDSIPTSANQEDHVSMGTIAARKAKEILANVRCILAIELFTASQAAYLRGADRLGEGTKKAYDVIRKHISPLNEDRILSIDINKMIYLIKKGSFLSLK